MRLSGNIIDSEAMLQREVAVFRGPRKKQQNPVCSGSANLQLSVVTVEHERIAQELNTSEAMQ